MVTVDHKDEDIQWVIALEMSLEDNNSPTQLRHLPNINNYHEYLFCLQIDNHETVMESHYLEILYKQIYLYSLISTKYSLGIWINGNDWRRSLLLVIKDLQQPHSEFILRKQGLTSFEDDKTKRLLLNNIQTVLDIDNSDFLVQDL